MKHIYDVSPEFRSRKVRNFVNSIIDCHDYKNYEDLCYSDKCEFASLLIESAGRPGESECILESNDLDKIIHLLKKSLCGSLDEDEDLIFCLKDAAIHYYEDIMHAIFSDVLIEREQAQEDWLDYISKHGDPDATYDYHREVA